MSAPPAKPTPSPFWRWFLRLSGAFALLAFLTPTGYVVKYYAFDKPREEARAHSGVTLVEMERAPVPDDTTALARAARMDSDPAQRIAALRALGQMARAPGVAYRRPMETLTAKATLADAAARDSDPAVRAAASETLAQVAQGGAVIRR